MTIPAGLPDPRPDQQYQSSGAAMAPGSQTPVVRARQVIVFGPSGAVVGIFVYAVGTKPGPGNAPVDSITRSATDPFGNPVQPDFVAYGGGGAYVQLTNGEINFLGSSSQFAPAQVRTENLAGLLDLGSGLVSGADTLAEITLLSNQANAGGGSQIQLSAHSLGGLLNLPVAPPAGPPSAPSSYTQTWGQGIDGVLNSIIATLGTVGIW